MYHKFIWFSLQFNENSKSTSTRFMEISKHHYFRGLHPKLDLRGRFSQLWCELSLRPWHDFWQSWLQLNFLCCGSNGYILSYFDNDNWQHQDIVSTYRISAETILFWRWKMWKFSYSFCSMAIFLLYKLNSCRGNYWRGETVEGRKLFAEIRHVTWITLDNAESKNKTKT